VFKLPEHIGLDVGALVEPLAVAWHAVDQVCFSPAAKPIGIVWRGGSSVVESRGRVVSPRTSRH
jgi:threonine dehydrogenase-like Zn-dependent dehydrogenase